MSANDLPLSNVINVSVSQTPTGIGQLNTSNVALFTPEAYANSFGSLGYAIYLDPTQVGIDFGTSSQTYKMALQVFSQQPNILANGGYLVVIPFVVAVQTLTLSGVPASGTFKIVFSQGTTAFINWNDTNAQILAKIQALAGLGAVTVAGTLAGGVLTITYTGVYGPETLPTISTNTLQTGGSVAITFVIAEVTAGETMAAAITRTTNLVQYFGIMATMIFGQTDMLAAAAVTQALIKMEFFVSRTAADVNPGGLLDMLRTNSYTRSRGLYYGGADDTSALGMMSAYVGRAMSTNFNGSNTTQTMHLKDLSGVNADPSMTQTILTAAIAAGAETYVSIAGVPKVFCSGTNNFFDDVYNLLWFVSALQVAGFNYLAQSSTKIPQTEDGMDGLKAAYRQVCEQAVTNQYSAAGAWTSPTTFGVLADFLANIKQRGYYIYSVPVSQQSQAARVARQAPLVQIALKEAGAVHSSSVIVVVNA